MRADTERDAVGLAVDHAAAPVIDAERVGGDLRHHGFKALADRSAAGENLDRARGVDGDFHAVGRAKPALFHEHGDADADQFAGGFALLHVGVELVPIDLGEQLVQQPDIVAGVVMDFLAQRLERARVGQFRRADGIAPADFDAVHAELRGDGVDQPLAHEGGLVAAGRAIGRRRRLVGEAEMADRAVGRHPIGAGQNARRHVHDSCGMRAHIGALVVEIEVVDGEDDAVGIDRGADLVQLLARMIGGDQMLAAVLDPFHRAIEFFCGDADQHVLGIKLAADAEAAADMGFVDMDRARRNA